MTNGNGETLSHAPSVLSMLKTTTETGDLGSFTVNQNRLPKLPRPGLPPRKGSNTAAPSYASSHYSRSGSLHSKASSRSFQGQGKHSLSQYGQNSKAGFSELHLPSQDTRSLTSHVGARASASSSTEKLDVDQRSYSLTFGPQTLHHLSTTKSIPSLRNHIALHHPQSPHRLSNRSRRFHSRPASPALSDTVAVSQLRDPMERLPQVGRAYNTSPFLPSTLGNGVVASGRRNPDLLFNVHKGKDVINKRLAANGRPTLPTHIEAPYQHRQSPSLTNLAATRANPAHSRPTNQWRPFPSTAAEPCSNTAIVERKDRSEPRTEPYIGFVQRVKSILEEKSSSGGKSPESLSKNGDLKSVHAETNTQVAELSASPVVIKRLTRDMIKAAMDASSDAGQGSSQETNDFGSSHDHSGFSTKDDLGDSTDESVHQMPVNHSVEENAEDFSIDANISHEKLEPTVAPLTIETYPEDAAARAHSTDMFEVSEAPKGFSQQILDDTGGQIFREMLVQDEGDESKKSDCRQLEQLLESADDKQYSPVPEDAVTSDMAIHVPDSQQSPFLKPLEDGLGLCNLDKSGATISKQVHNDPGANYTPTISVMESNALDTPTTFPSRNSPATRAGGTKEFPYSKSEGRAISRASVPRKQTSGPSPWRSSSRSSNALDSLDLMSHWSWNSSTTDLRLSAMKQFQFPLPDLTEDSQEDASTTNLRMLGSRPPVFRHHGLKQQVTESRLLTSGAPTSESTKTYLGLGLAESHALPSLQFSRADLTTSLNYALGLRSSRSFEDLRRTKSLTESSPVSERPESSINLRNRYRSFFSMTEDSKSSTDEGFTSDDNIDTEIQQDNELVTELKRLSIPSVSGLTLRLSELIPTIKKGTSAVDLTKNDESASTTVDEIRGIGSSEKTASGDYTHVSQDSISSEVSPENRKLTTEPIKSARSSRKLSRSPLLLMKDLPPLPVQSDDTHSASGSDQDERTPMTLGQEHEKAPSELEANVPARHLSSVVEDIKPVGHHSKENGRLERPSNSHTRSNTPDSRPWNRESNYPWEDSAPPVDMRFSESNNWKITADRSRYQVRRSRSTSDLPADDSVHIARSMSPGPHMESSLVPQAALFSDADKGTPKKGIIGSLSRKMGIKPRVDKAGFPIDPLFLYPEDRVTEPGDRYPTSGLTPPSGLSIDANRSYFSDDSSDSERANAMPLRKRLTRLRPRRSTLRANSPRASQTDGFTETHGPGNDSSVFVDSHVGSSDPDMMVVYDDKMPAGMSKLEFRTKRMVEKLRTIWFKSGELIRSISRTKNRPPSWYEANDLYPGV